MSPLDTLINDRYRLIRKLGEGGMGEVYLAEDLTMQRQVAIKFIRGALGDPDSYTRLLQRFQREARTLAKLSHPNIVGVYDYGDYDGRPYLVMEYLPGGSLAERMGTPFPWQEACKLAATVAKALAFAHSEGVLHRDIKPSNILFTKSGEPVVSDFGLAKVLDPGGAVVDSNSDTFANVSFGTSLGTPAYMAPEQWSGQASEQSDVYSLGVVLFQMLTGQVPYPGKTTGEVVNKQITGKLPAARSINPNIPPIVESFLEKSLEREPAYRVENMIEYASALTALEKGKASKIQGYRTPVENKGEGSVKNKVNSSSKPELGQKLWLRFGALVLLFLAGVLVWALLFWGGVSLFKRVTGRSPTLTTEPVISPTPIKPPEIGSTMVSDKDGMVMVYVPGGVFTMGSDDGIDYAKPAHAVYLDAYWIDQTEITNAMYAKCVKAKKCSRPGRNSSIKFTSYYGNPDFDAYPVIYVNWNQAKAYCKWAGRNLPTEAQWENAAKGTDGNTYPWGNQEPNCTMANYGLCIGDTTKVGNYPNFASLYGAYDMAGNVKEWVFDYVDLDGYTIIASPVINPTGPVKGLEHGLRGGSWDSLVYNLFSASRDFNFASSQNNRQGFRCVLSPIQTP